MDQTKIWEHFQNDEEAGHVAFNAHARYEFLTRHIKAGTKVLNIGVGRGDFESLLIAKGANVSCLDPSERSINRMRERLGLGERAKVGFSQYMPFPDAIFDAVIMSEVLEHLDDEALRRTLMEVRRVLKSDGLFLGTVPAEENLLESRVVCPHCGKIFHRWGHVRSFSCSTLQCLLQTQFSEVVIWRRYFLDLKNVNWKGLLLWGAKRLAMAIRIHGQGETFFFKARNS